MLLTGIKVGHSTYQRKVQTIECPVPDVKQKLSEVSLDGGLIRLRGENQGVKSYWKEYKTARLQGIYYGAFFQDNLSLTDWINSQQLTVPLYCVGDGHDGVWNLMRELGENHHRIEILDWYHLVENREHPIFAKIAIAIREYNSRITVRLIYLLVLHQRKYQVNYS